jgi:hypothetical protein
VGTPSGRGAGPSWTRCGAFCRTNGVGSTNHGSRPVAWVVVVESRRCPRELSCLRSVEDIQQESSARPDVTVACDISRSFPIHWTSAFPRHSTHSQGPNDDHELTMAAMNGTRVSVVVFATSFLLGASGDSPCFDRSPHAVQSRAAVHALDRGFVDSVEAAGHR